MKPTHIKSTVIALFCGISAMAQLHNAHWVFGTDLGLSFQSGNPELTSSSCDPSSARQPAVISDESGNLVCYTDGDKVYNSSHDVIENGDLSMAAENLIVPAPGYDDRYYLFRSNGSGFFYCIIDMSMDGGSGGIQPGDVDIEINNVYCQVTGTAHPNGTDIWIITSDNE
ncbi:MAG: hypothetical protein JNM00_03935, partial [Flavobacteriales bacterium]|nr:hypothetical protein [Flavobacteriales bacterium]